MKKGFKKKEWPLFSFQKAKGRVEAKKKQTGAIQNKRKREE